MPIVGILGGIGSGKSSVVRKVKDLRLRIIDADKIGHELLANRDIQSQLRASFGDEIFLDQNTVSRAALANAVFGNDQTKTSALENLNRILHPAIRREIHSQIQSTPSTFDAVILDAALLLEVGWEVFCQRLIFIDTPKPIRELRVRENRNWEPDELSRREASQLPVAEKKKRAHFVVDNSGTIDVAAEQMTTILTKILHESRSGRTA